MDTVFGELRGEKCSERSLAHVEQWLRESPPADADEVEQFLGNLIETFEFLAGEPVAQAALLTCLAVSFPRLAAHVNLGDVQMIVMFVSELTTTDSPVLLPAVIDVSASVYCGSMQVLLRCEASLAAASDGEVTQDQLAASLAELESLRKMACVAASQQQLPTLVRLHAVNAMRDIVLAVTEPAFEVVIEVADPNFAAASQSESQRRLSLIYNYGRGIGYVPVPPGGKVLTRELLSHVAADVVAALVAVAAGDRSRPGILLGVLSAAEVLLCNRPGTWDVLIPHVCALGTHSASLHNSHAAFPSIGAARDVVSGVLRSLAVEAALTRFCSLVLAISACSKYHVVARAALEAVGSGLDHRQAARHMATLAAAREDYIGNGAARANNNNIDAAGEMPEEAVAAALVQPTARLLNKCVARDGGSGGAGGSDGDVSGDEDSGSDSESGKELIETALGPLSLPDMVDMIVHTLRVGIDSESAPIRDQHMDGLRQLQYVAAREAQWVEIVRARQQERQGIAGIAPSELVDYIKGGVEALSLARLRLESPAFRSMFARAAFLSILDSYKALALESEEKIRQAQGLIARAVVQLPDIVSDVACDVLCEMLQDEAKSGSLDGSVHSTASLVMQVLFMLYSQLAPLRQTRASGLFSFTMEQAWQFNAASVRRVLEPDNPLAWMFGGEAKRFRGDDPAPAASSTEATAEPDAGDDSWAFTRDTPAHTTAYSAFATRVMHVLKLNVAALRGMLLQAPAITVPMWQLIRNDLCLAESQEVNRAGIQLLVAIMLKRAVYSFEALTMLLSLCIQASPKRVYARLWCLKQMQHLVQKRLVDRALVLDFACQQLRRLPALAQQIGVSLQPPAGAAGAARHEKLLAHINTALDFFLALCSVEGNVAMFLTLLEVFAAGEALQSLLLRNERIRRFIHKLAETFETAPLLFSVIVPQLQDHPKGSEELVQQLLRFAMEKLRENFDSPDVKGSEKRSLQWKRYLQDLIAVCIRLFDKSVLAQAPITSQGAPPKDARFVIPVLSFIKQVDLRRTYIPMIVFLTTVERGEDAVRLAFAEILRPRDLTLADDDVEMKKEQLLVFLHELEQAKVEGITRAMTISCIKQLLMLRNDMDKLVVSGIDIVRALITMGDMRPVPTLMMRTAIDAARLPQHRADDRFIRNVCESVIKKLMDQQVWNADNVLWRGVLHFINENWGTHSMNALLSLPVRIVTKTLRENSGLLEKFKESPGSDAHTHILSAI